MWLNQTTQLLLASASPRRVELLEQIQIPTQQVIVPSPDGEDEPRQVKETVVSYVTRTTDDKLTRALDFIQNHNDLQQLPILTADTTVALEQTILGKPTDADDAVRILSLLSGHRHDVYTAVSLHYEQMTYRALSHTIVTFDTLKPTQINQYVASKEPFGKAGAYAIQGLSAQFIKKIEGSYSTVMGLPLFELSQLLRQAALIS